MQELDERILSAVARQDWIDGTAKTIQGWVRGLFSTSDAWRTVKDLLHGTWLAHPVHAVVTDVAIGAWTTAQVMDVAEMIGGRRRSSAAATGAIAVGLGGAVVSAASGIADWSDTRGEQRRVGLIHAALNVAAVSMYVASLASRLGGHRSSGKLFSGAGFLTVLVSGYLGGDLAYRLGTQVDRNAWAGEIDDFATAIQESELAEGKPVRVEVMGAPVMLVRAGGRINAMSDNCSHAGCSLAEGEVVEDTVVCRCHGSTYRLEDGIVVHGPSAYAQPSYEVRVRKGQVEIRSRSLMA